MLLRRVAWLVNVTQWMSLYSDHSVLVHVRSLHFETKKITMTHN